MVDTLLVSAAFALLSAAIYVYVGWRLGRRKVSDDAQLASRLFSVWWYGLAGTTAVGAIQSVAVSLGRTDLTLFVTFTYLNILVICIALWGLVYYLVYLFTGSSRALVPLTGFYIAYYIFLVYYITASGPMGVNVGRWTTSIRYENPLTGPLFTLLVLGLLLPQILGALAYGTLYFRVREPTQRYRVALVSLSILVWFGAALVQASFSTPGQQNDTWPIISRFIALAAALTILMAYVPPQWVRRKWGIAPIEAGPPRAGA